MFENLVECSRDKQRSKKWAYFMVTSVIWTLALVVTIVTGIFIYDAQLDKQLHLLTMIEPLPPPPPPPPYGSGGGGAPKTKQTTVIQREMTSVRETPSQIDDISDSSLVRTSDNAGGGSGEPGGDPNGVVGGLPGGKPGGMLDGIHGSNTEPPQFAPVTDQPAPPPPPKPSTVVQSEGVIRGNALVKIKPEYPAMARTAGLKGDVQIEITIGEDGNVADARIISGHALLRQAALDAARRWKFNPTLLNKTPVKVQGILTFRFTL